MYRTLAAMLLLAQVAQARVVSSVEAVQVQIRRAREVTEVTVDGERFLALVYAEETRHIPIDDAGPYLRYLKSPIPVSRAELQQMLRGWHGGTVDDDAFARWLAEVKPVAQVDDWTVDDTSLTLSAIEDLNYRIKGEPLDQVCVCKVLREQVAPVYIRALENSAPELPHTELIELEECQ